MNPDQARALLIVAALLSGASGSAGFVGGRATAPIPPAEVRTEVRYVPIPVPAAVVMPPEAAPVELALPVPPAPQIEPETPAPVETKPPPKVDAKPKAQPKPKPEAKPRPPAPKKSLPSCAVIKREYETMSWAQQMAAYRRATPEQIAHGKRCLGM